MATFSTPMPSSTQRAHARGAEWRGDRSLFIRQVGRHALGRDHIRAADLNFIHNWNLHWGVPKKDNYKYVVDATTRRVRRMTRAELRTFVSGWPDGATRWRRRRSVVSERPHTYAEVVKYAMEHGVVVCAELKWIPSPAEAAELVAAAKAANHPPYFMAMLRQSRRASTDICQTKCEHVVEAGGQFAVIHGRGLLGRANRRLSGRVTPGWSPGPTRIW